jgi:uncharacterized coiled-coil DUF342 family protein
MAETKTSSQKFDPVDLQAINKLREKTDRLVYQLGQIEQQQNSLKRLKTSTFEQIDELQSKEKQLAKQLSSKYGTGTLDMESGTFTPES